MCECGICIILLAGTVSEFKKKFETPILRGRDADASDADHKKGAEKLAEVALYTVPECFKIMRLRLPPLLNVRVLSILPNQTAINQWS